MANNGKWHTGYGTPKGGLTGFYYCGTAEVLCDKCGTHLCETNMALFNDSSAGEVCQTCASCCEVCPQYEKCSDAGDVEG